MAIHVLERLPGGAPLRFRELKAQPGLERLDDLLAVGDRLGGFRGEAGSHQGEGGLELEQLCESHPVTRHLPLELVVGLMAHPDRFGDREQMVPFAHVVGQHVLQLARQPDHRIDPGRDLLR